MRFRRPPCLKYSELQDESCDLQKYVDNTGNEMDYKHVSRDVYKIT